jgi:ABC-2 type transport system permease protein
MAVYKRSYKRYEGALTSERWRFTVLPRYSFRTAFESKLFTSFFTGCMLPPFVAAVLIYVKNNIQALQSLNLQPLQFLDVNSEFFVTLLTVQTVLSFFIVTLIGPGLVAPDLANNALPLYLSRPFSRAEYVLGKLTVLAALTSLVTWIPTLLVIGVQVNMAGVSWLLDNVRLPVGVFVGSWIWILTISLVSLAISAWVKFRPIATASLFGVFFVLGAFGEIANGMLRLHPGWGSLLNIRTDMGRLWTWLLSDPTVYQGLVSGGSREINGLPIWGSFVAMAGFSGIALFLLNKKVRAAEVVRG